MRALAQLAPMREHEEARRKLEAMKAKRAKAKAKKDGASDDGFKSIMGW
jgi:hypothetical protein